MTENFWDKISCSTWTEIKENVNSTKTKHFRHKLACTKVACIWFKLINNVMFSEMGKVPKSTKLLLPKLLFFFWIK